MHENGWFDAGVAGSVQIAVCSCMFAPLRLPDQAAAILAALAWTQLRPLVDEDLA